jgi:hypothetical protein
MRQWIRAHLTYANVMVTILAFVVLTGGTAVALNGSNTVQSDDLGPGAQVKAADVADNAVNGADVANNSLRNTDLGVRVRSEQQVDDGSGGSICGQTATFDECITVNFTNPRPQRLLLVGSGEWTGSSFSQNSNTGECRFSVGNLATLGLRRFGETSDSPSAPFNFAMNSVTGVLDAGFHEIGIDCRTTSGNLTVRRTELSVVALGDG